MTRRKDDLPPPNGDRSVLGCRVSDDTQRRFRKFVSEHVGNHQGAYGKAVEWAMEEYMGDDRYARIEDGLRELQDTVHHTNALVRQLITAEKEKGAFLEDLPTAGNQAGDRTQREGAVVQHLADRIANGELPRQFTEGDFNAAITEAAGVSSTPSKRDYRETLQERGLVEAEWGKYVLTDSALRLAGYAVRGGET